MCNEIVLLADYVTDVTTLWFPTVAFQRAASQSSSGSRGRVQGMGTPPPQDDLRFSNTTGILQNPALKVTDDGRGQLGHVQRELVPVLARFPVLIVNLSIMNHFIEKFLFSNCFKYILEGDLSDSIETGCLLTVFSSKQNRTNRVDWVRLVRLSSVIELTEKFQLNLLRRKETKKI